MNSSILYCRTCAQLCVSSTEVKAIFQNTEVVAVIKSLEGWCLNITENDELPQEICVKCEQMLLQIRRFQVAATEAKQHLGSLFTKQLTDRTPSALATKSVKKSKDILAKPAFETLTLEEPYVDVDDERQKCSKFVIKVTGKRPQVVTSRRLKLASKSATEPFKIFRCNYCMGKRPELPFFPTKAQLQEHIAAVHDNPESPYNCPQCSARYQTKAGCQSHINSIHLQKSVCCHICGRQVIGGEGKMREHIQRNHTHADYTCDICLLVMKNVTLYCFNYHKRWHKTEKLFKCQHCEKMFVRHAHLLAHQTTHTKQGQFLCTHCGKSIRNKWQLRAHLYAIHDEGKAPLNCDYCDKKFAQYSHRRTHLEKNHPKELTKRTIPCAICHKRFRNEVNLQRHLKRPHKTPMQNLHYNPKLSNKYSMTLLPAEISR